MHRTGEAVGAARLIMIVFAVWSAVVGFYGRPAPLFPDAVRAALGVAVAVMCLAAASWPSPGRYRWAFAGVAAFAAASTARTILGQPFDVRSTAVAASTYAAMAMAAFGLSITVAILAAINDLGGGDGWAGTSPHSNP